MDYQTEIATIRATIDKIHKINKLMLHSEDLDPHGESSLRKTVEFKKLKSDLEVLKDQNRLTLEICETLYSWLHIKEADCKGLRQESLSL